MPRACNKLGLETFVQLIAEEYVLPSSLTSNLCADIVLLAVHESSPSKALLLVALRFLLPVHVSTLSPISCKTPRLPRRLVWQWKSAMVP
jgi:hypothetical protein